MSQNKVALVEDDIRLVLGGKNSSFNTYEISPGIYNFKDISEVLLKYLQSEYPGRSKVIDNEFDDINRKTKLDVKDGLIAIGFDEKSFFNTILSFTPHWDYNHDIKYIVQKTVIFSSTNKIPLKWDVIDGSIIGGLKQSILFSFVLDKPSWYKVFCEPGTIHFKNKDSCFVYHNNLIYLEDNNHKENNFNGETLTFPLQMIKIYCIEWVLIKFECDSYCVGGRHRSGTKIYGKITAKGSKVLIGYCSICNRKNLWLLVITL